MSSTRINHLKELNHSDYKIADNQPDIENWKIVDTTGRKVGKVQDLLFDKEAMKVRYIVTDLKDGDLTADNRKVLIPIGKARLNTNSDRVEVANITNEHISTLPDYRSADALTQQDEYAVRNSFSEEPIATDTYDRNTFYDNKDFDEDYFYNEDNNMRDNAESTGKVDVIEEDIEVGKREVQTGGARLKSRIVERPVEERVNLKEEHVQVKRTPVDKPADGRDFDNYKEKTIEETESAEVPVVNKEARVVEEVSLEKEVENKQEVVKDNVRHTEVDVENLSEEERMKWEKEQRNRNA